MSFHIYFLFALCVCMYVCITVGGREVESSSDLLQMTWLYLCIRQ